jgi:amino acid adenylation domain-containing protein
MAYLLHHLLTRAAAAVPDSMAVVDGNRRLSYADLDRESSRLAHALLDRGVSRGDRVGLYLDKSLESIIGIYAILKAGAAYVPLDPHAPVARLAYILGNCDVRVLLTGREKASTWDELAARHAGLSTLFLLNGDQDPRNPAPCRVVDRAAVAEQPSTAPNLPTIDQDLAYILYTSGSTGDPKGVMLTHRNSLAFVQWAAEEFGVGPEDVLSSHAPLHFDLSIFDIFAAAAGCATVVLVPPRIAIFPTEIARFIERHGITIWYSVPSVLTRLVEQTQTVPGSFPHLRTVLFAGEVFPTRFLRSLMDLLPETRFCNLYGPTETNVCTWYDVPRLDRGQTEPVPIGKAIANDEVFAVKDDGAIAGVGEVGELCVRGATVMQGYWGDPERTERTLRPVPVSGLADMVYRTGDLVRQDDDGNYHLIGRRDAQVKSRGYRIELGEIETALVASPSVVECAVVAVPDEIITNRLIAHVVVKNNVGEADLVRLCAEKIPRYMIPEAFYLHDSLPKTSTGKLDRQQLARASVTRDPVGAIQTPTK